MNKMKRPWGIQAISDIYSRDCRVELADGRWPLAVAEPYPCNIFERIRAAWWVLTGKAVAFTWPKPGELERLLDLGVLCDRETPDPSKQAR